MEKINMTDPASAAAGGTLAHKIGVALVLGMVSILAPLLAFVLGLQVIPLSKADPHGDVTRRLLGCAVSSFLVGVPLLVLLHHSLPWVYISAREVGAAIGAPEAGIIALIGVVLLQSALPGWWLVGSLVRKYAAWDGKAPEEIYKDIKQDLSP